MPLLLCMIYFVIVWLLGYTLLCVVLGRGARHWAQIAGLSLELPDGDGCELLLKLRGELGMDILRAIAFSGCGNESMIERAKAAGFDAYMLKPVEIGQFFGLLEQVCRAQHPPRSPKCDFIAVLAHPI